MKRNIIILIFLVILTNIVFAQSDVENLRGEIRKRIISISNEFHKVKNLVDDRKVILRGCLYRENMEGAEACFEDDFDNLLEHLETAINRLSNMNNPGGARNIEEFWENLNSGFPLLYVPLTFSSVIAVNEFWAYRHTYTIAMGVNEVEYIMREIHTRKIARDIIRIHVLNANDSDQGTNYDDFFDSQKFSGNRDYYKTLAYNLRISNNPSLDDALKEGTGIDSALTNYLNYLKNKSILNKIKELTRAFEKVIGEYNARIESGISLCLTTLKELEEKIKNENNTTTLNNILQNLDEFQSAMSSNLIGDEKTIPELLAAIYRQGFLITFNKAEIRKDLDEGNKRGYQHVFPNNLDNEIKFWNDLYLHSKQLFNSFFMYCVGDTLIKGQTPGGRNMENLRQNLENAVQNFNNKFSFSFALIEVTPQEISLAVIPPVVWSDQHRGRESFKEITPGRIFDEIRNFLFSLAPIMFILLLVVGAIFYIVSPIKIEYIKTGSEYIKWAVIGYFLLLAISAIFSALKVIFGAP